MSDYYDLADRIAALPHACRHARDVYRLHLRDTAIQIGVGYADLSRFERGELDVRMSTLVKIARWVDERERESAERAAEWMRQLMAEGAARELEEVPLGLEP